MFPTSVPPKIFVDKKYDETIYLYAGQSTAFEVPFTGNPQPKVTWTFNGGDLPDKKRMEAETIYNMTTIRMGHVQRSDTGDYSVTLANDNGKATITIKLVVLGEPTTFFPVTIVSMLQIGFSGYKVPPALSLISLMVSLDTKHHERKDNLCRSFR